MKLFHTLALCLCVMSVCAQAPMAARPSKSDGTYLFQKAVLTVYNANTKAVVDTRTITDPATLSSETDVFYRNIFLEAAVKNGELRFCTLPDKRSYLVTENTTLTAARKYSKEETSPLDYVPVQVEPYVMSVNGNTLTFTLDYFYGESRYSFPLEGKLVLTMTQK